MGYKKKKTQNKTTREVKTQKNGENSLNH